MSNQSLMKPKSVLTKRRKVIAFLLATILTVAVVTGFSSGFSSDGTIYTPDGERIVMWEPIPSSGAPEDYDLLSNVKYTAQRIYTASYFKGVTDGKVVANVGMGIKYTQNVHNTRVVKGDKVFSEAISTSAAKSVAEQKYIERDVVLYRPATSISGNSASYADSVYKMPMEEYYRSYGAVPNELSKYIINEKTILSVKDDNALTRSALNAPANADGDENPDADGSSVTFHVPQTLVADEDGNYSVTLELDPVESTKYYRNEVRTLGGADHNPVFYSVHLSIKIDSNWYPISITSVENYDIAIPVLGAMNCTGTLTEIFSDIDDENGEIPEYEFFSQHMNDIGGGIGQTLSPADYLSQAFSSYLDGSSNLDISADVKIGDVALDGLRVSANLGTMNIRAKYDRLYIEYSGDKVYITLNNIKGYISTDKAAALIENEAVKSLMSGIALPDFDELLGGDLLTTVFENCEMTSEDGITCIRLPFKLSDIDIDAYINIKDEDMTLVSITGKVNAFGKEIEVSAKPKKAPSFPTVDSSYVDLSGMIDFVPDALATALEKTYGVNGTVTAYGQTVGVNAYIDRADGSIDATLTALGQNIGIQYVNDKIYVSVGNIKAAGSLDELQKLASAVAKIADIDTESLNSMLPMLKALIPSTVGDILSMLDSLEVNGNTLKAKLNVIAVPIDVTVTRGNGRITGLSLDAKVDMAFGKQAIKFDASADLAVSNPQKRPVTPEGEYVTFAQLTEFITSLQPYVDAKAYSAELDGTVSVNSERYELDGTVYMDRTADTDGNESIAVDGAVNVLNQTVEIKYIDGVAYLAVGNIRVKIATADINDILSALGEFGINVPKLDSITDLDELSDTLDKALGAVYSFDIENGVLKTVLDFDGYKVTVTADPDTGAVTVIGNLYGAILDITVTVKTENELRGIQKPSAASEYVDIAELTDALPLVSDVLNKKGATATLDLGFGDINYKAALKVSTDGAVSVTHKPDSLPVDISYIDGTAYIAYGDILLKGTLDDIKYAMSELNDVMPAEALDVIDRVTAMLKNTDISAMLDTALTAVTDFTLNNGILTANVLYDGASVSLSVAKSLSNATVTANVEQMQISVGIEDISAESITVEIPDGDYAQTSTIVSTLMPIVPLATEEAVEITVNAELYGVAVTGSVYADFGSGTLETVQAEASLTVGDLPVTLKLKNKTLYIALGDNLRISEQLSRQSILGIASKLDGVVDGAADLIQQIFDCIDNFNIYDLLDSVTLSSAQNGFTATIDLSGIGFDATVAVSAFENNGTLSSLSMNCALFGLSAELTFDAVTEDGKLTELRSSSAKIDSVELDALNLAIGGTTTKAVTPIDKCASLSGITNYVQPVYDIVKNNNDVKSLTLSLGAFALTSENKRTDISGAVTVNLDPLAIDVTITLFKSTDAEEDIKIKYVGKVLYIASGSIKLMLNLNSQADLQRLYDVLDDYLPEYLNEELAKLFGLEEGTSVLSDISLLIERIKQIADAGKDPEQIITLLFSDLNGLSGNSAAKKIVDMTELSEVDGNTVISLNALGLSINAVPYINATTGALDTAKIYTNIGILDDLYFEMRVNSYALSDEPTTISAPTDTDAYVSIAEFAEVISNAANTLTTKDSNGNITFELKTFDYDYDVFKIETTEDADGNTVNVKDAEGRDKPLTDDNGKVIDKKIFIKNADASKSAVKGKFVPYEVNDKDGKTSVKYKLNLEAHIKIDIQVLTGDKNPKFASKVGMPVKLDLYVANNDKYPKGMAFIDYAELDSDGKPANGERISIDYASMMEIVAAVMDIMGVDDDTAEMLVGDYRQTIDTSVFDAMEIIGLGDIRDMLDNIAGALKNIKSAKEDLTTAWDLIKTAGDELPEDIKAVDVLRDRFPEIKKAVGKAISSVKAAIELFGDKNKSTTPTQPQNVINGKLYKDVVNAVSFDKSGDVLSATIKNAIATHTQGTATVNVTQNNGTIDSIEVGGLDVNTARLNGLTALFTAGTDFEDDDDIDLPSGYNSSNSVSRYSDFANVKHLLFDVMNTANMFEFEIGGGANDQIKMSLHLGSLPLKDVVIDYSAKVKIMDQGKNAKPRYKTGADIELRVNGAHTNAGRATVFLVPECTTRLFFYDNVLYMHGVESWEGVVSFSNWKYHYTYNVNYTDTMLTVDDFSNMLKSDKGIEKLFKEFVFRLVPLRENLVVNIHDEIINAVKNSGKADPAMKTFAQIFKSYEYANGVHTAVIGLKELALDNSLSDVTLKLTGANDGDSNILDNYISKLYAETTFASIATLYLDASLVNTSTPTYYYVDKEFTKPSPENARTDNYRNELKSTGLTATVIDGKNYSLDGKPCKDNSNVLSIVDTLLASVTKDAKGKITSLTNREGGTQWKRIWEQTPAAA